MDRLAYQLDRRYKPSVRATRVSISSVVLGVAAVFAVVAVALSLRKVDVAAQPSPLVVPSLPDRSSADGGSDIPLDDVAEEPVASPVSVGGVPEQLDRRQLEAAMARVKPSVLHCRGQMAWGGYAGELAVHMIINTSGSLSSVSIVGVPPEEAHTPLGDCVLRAVRGIYFPRFRGTLHPTVEWTYPFVLRD